MSETLDRQAKKSGFSRWAKAAALLLAYTISPCKAADGAAPNQQVVERQAPAPTSSVNIPQNAPAGSMSVLNPPITASPTLIKILSGNPITFSWSLASVISTPAAITMQAFCSQNQNTYPIGPTQGVPGTQTTYVWDPAAYQFTAGALPLPQASCTFRAFDERGWLQGPTAGLMSPQNGPVFALYSPQAYTPLSSWTCVQCSAAEIWRATNPVLLILIVTIVSAVAGGWSVFGRNR